MDSSYLWFRFTQVAMKVVPILVTLVLLAPLAVIFWRMVKHHPKSEAETRAELEQLAREQLAKSQAEFQSTKQEAQAQTREFQKMLEQAKESEADQVISSDGEMTEMEERVEALERYLADGVSAPTPSNMDGVFMGTIVTYEERVCLTAGTSPWFALYPRRWVGITALAAVILLLGLVVWSTLVPARPAISVSGSLDGAGIQIQDQAPPAGGRP